MYGLIKNYTNIIDFMGGIYEKIKWVLILTIILIAVPTMLVV